MDDDVGFEVKIDAAEKSQKPELVVQSNLIQGKPDEPNGPNGATGGERWLLAGGLLRSDAWGLLFLFFSHCRVRSLEVDAPGEGDRRGNDSNLGCNL